VIVLVLLALLQGRPDASPVQALSGPQVITVDAHYRGTQIIENKTIACTAPGQTALSIVFPTAPAVAEVSIIVRNVTVTPGCANGIHLINAWSAIIDSVNVYGAYGDSVLQNGLIVQGQSHDVRVTNMTVMHAVTGIYIIEASEGTVIDKSTLLGVTHGIFAHSQYAGRPWMVVSNSHIAASRGGIFAINRKQVTIHDTLIYRHLRGYQPGWRFEGIHLANTTEAVVRDVIVDCWPDRSTTYPGTGTALVSTTPPMRAEIHKRDCQ
jgi:hypothetical protein